MNLMGIYLVYNMYVYSTSMCIMHMFVYNKSLLSVDDRHLAYDFLHNKYPSKSKCIF